MWLLSASWFSFKVTHTAATTISTYILTAEREGEVWWWWGAASMWRQGCGEKVQGVEQLEGG